MCSWFSFVVTRDGYIYYISREERLQLNKSEESADHHSRIIREAQLSELAVDKMEYNPITKKLTLDCVHSKYIFVTSRWRDAWFSRSEILETLNSMPLSEMLPKNVKFDMVLYKKLLKKQTILYQLFSYGFDGLLWIGMGGFRRALSNMFWLSGAMIGLSLTWKGESKDRKSYRRKILEEIGILRSKH